MMLVDTNTLIRLVTNDNPQQAQEVKQTIAEATTGSLVLTDAVLAEMCFVLEFNPIYRLGRSFANQALAAILSFKAFAATPIAERALFYYTQDSKLDFTDCLLIAQAQRNRCDILSFDKHLQKVHATSKG